MRDCNNRTSFTLLHALVEDQLP